MNTSKKNDSRFWRRWRESGACRKFSTWHYKIGDREERTVSTVSSIYEDGVMAAIRECGLSESKDLVRVVIWMPNLLPDYGPYVYYFSPDHNLLHPFEAYLSGYITHEVSLRDIDLHPRKP